MRDIAVLLLWIALIPAAFARPYIGVMLWVWTALLTPNFYVYGFLSDVPFNKIVAIVTVISLVISAEPKRIAWNSTLILLAILFVQGTVFYMLCGDNVSAPPIFDRFWKELTLCVFIAITVTSRLRIHCLLGIAALALCVPGIIEGLKVIASGGGHHIQGIASFGDNNQSALALLMVIPVLNYLSQQSANRLVKYTYLGALVLTVVAVVGTWSRGAFVGLAVLGMAFVILSKNKFRSMALVCVILSVVMSVASFQYLERVQSIESADQDVSFIGRIVAWKISFAIARDNPFFGGGFHSIQDPRIWRNYQRQIEIPEAYRAIMAIVGARAAHSIYFEVLGDLGFMGLLIFLAILAAGFYNTRRIIKFSKSKSGLEWVYGLGIMFRLMLLVYCISGAAVSMAWFEFNFIVLMLLAILARFCDEMETASIGGIEPARGEAAAFGLNVVGRPVEWRSKSRGH
jgi:putative inorganic carbon (HCO3(-)) transporter